MQQAGDEGEKQRRSLRPPRAGRYGQFEGVIDTRCVQQALHAADIHGVIIDVFERQRRKYKREQRHAESPNVRGGRPIATLSPQELRRQEALGAGSSRSAAAPHCVREPIRLSEVGYEKARSRCVGRLVDEHVAWFKVLVQDARAVYGAEAGSGVGEELQNAHFAEIDAFFGRSG